MVDAVVFNETICLNILDYLQGWSTESDVIVVDGESLQVNHNNVISVDEVERYFNRTVVYAENFMCRSSVPNVPEIVYGVVKWCAGLLYKKYNVRANDNMEDDNMQVGYGDFLIHDAKEDLTPYMVNKLTLW